MIKSNRKFLSLLLALSMLLSMAVIPATAAGGTPAGTKASLALDKSTLSLAESGQTFTATLTLTPSAGAAKWTPEAWAGWAKGLNWSLTRTEKDTVMDPKLYPHIYTGDKLEKWQSWGSNGKDGSPYFKVEVPTVALDKGVATLTLKFTTGTFYVDENGVNVMHIPGADPDPARNMHGSFIGPYRLAVQEDGLDLASTVLNVNLYEGYHPYSGLKAELESIKALAEKKGRYFEIVENGLSADGNIQYLAILSDSKQSVNAYKAMNKTAVTDPAALQAKLKNKTMGEYRVPYFLNNVHPDECSAADAILGLLRALAGEDSLSYNTLTALKGGKAVDKTLFDPKVAAMPGFTGLGSRKLSGDPETGMNSGKTDASAFYDISGDKVMKVNDILKNIIFVTCPIENPDGRAANLRQNGNGFDLNRDASNQNQPETTSLMEAV
ncbi:MAG: hypothetical protein RR450_08570, partial [Oscillospiraceae bacterium]